MERFFSIINKNKLIFFLIAGAILIVGFLAYIKIPKEHFPDVKLATVNVTVPLVGISPEDAEKMIVLPIEKSLRSLDDIKKVTSFSTTGVANITIQFNQNISAEKGTQDVRNKIQESKIDLPKDILEPIIQEIDFSKIPILSVALINKSNENDLFSDAKFMKKQIEQLHAVSKVTPIGLRKEIIACKVDPAKWNLYGLSIEQIAGILNANNNLVSLGEMVNSSSTSIRLSGLLRNDHEIKDLPIFYRNNAVVKLGDICNARLELEEQRNFGRVNENQSVVLQIAKKSGLNIVETIESIKNLVEKNKEYLSGETDIIIMRDTANSVKTSLHDLINNIIFAIILVMLVIIVQIGIKQGIIVGLSIPLSFYMGILIIWIIGYSMNIVILFGLIMVTGMIVDAAIIVTEDADCRMHNGSDPVIAYIDAAQRMMIPVLSATVGIIVVFMPLLFWPGTIGQFIKYIPITLIIVLSCSIIVAMIFVPIIGGWFCSKFGFKDNLKQDSFLIKSRNAIDNLSNKYISILSKILDKPKRIPIMLIFVFIFTIVAYKFFGKGTQFFPTLEPEVLNITIRSSGNLSYEKKLQITKNVEKVINRHKDQMKSVYSNVNPSITTVNDFDDTVAIISLEYKDWKERLSSDKIISKLKTDLLEINGVDINVTSEKQGPSSGKYDIELNIIYDNVKKMKKVISDLKSYIKSDSDYADIFDTESSNKIEWNVIFNREVALKSGITLDMIGNAMRMLTVGMPVGKVAIDKSDEKIDLILMYPKEYRTITNLQNMLITDKNGKNVAIGNFMKIKPEQEILKINRINYNKVAIFNVNVKPGIIVNNKIYEIKNWIKNQNYDRSVQIIVAGDQEDQEETSAFLGNAFAIAIIVKAVILIAQFNSVYYTLVVLSSVVLSIIGVLWGLMIAQMSFCIVMCGLGVIALAGIVVSNNIILIDTYQKLIADGVKKRIAILDSCKKRIRPIILTSATTTIGLMPMIFNINIDFLHFGFDIGGPSGLWWQHLALTIGSGLVLTTLLTLFFTPCLLELYTPKKD